MTASTQFENLSELLRTSGPSAVFDQLAAMLLEQRDYHKLFDARCQQKKFELGIPLHRPTSFEDVPADKRDAFEAAYVAAAREAGQLLLADKKLGQAWMYFHAIRETEPIKEVIEKFPLSQESGDETEELIDVAFSKMVHPVKGIQVLLRTHGTCNTITSLDQQFRNLTPQQRSECASVLVQSLHDDLVRSVQHEVKKRFPMDPPAKTLRELIAGRDWLFEENNYHIDVSHLHSTVRFARSLNPGSTDLALARDLAEYGSQLSTQFRYPGEPPFADYYPSHIQFFKFLADDERAASLNYFQQQLDSSTEESDQAMIAYVMVDLLSRTDQYEQGIPLAEKYLLKADPDFVAAFAELCQKANRLDALKSAAQSRGDLVAFAAALVQEA